MISRLVLPHILFVVVTFLMGPALVLQFGKAPATDTMGDTATTQWNFWWIGLVLESMIGWRDLPSGDGFFHTSFLFHPVGTSLAWHTLDLTYGLLLWPLQPYVGVLGQHAIALLMATYLTAWFAWGAAKELGCRGLGASLAVIAISLHGYRMGESLHLNLYSSFLFLGCFWLLLRLRSEEPRGWSVLGLGLWAWVTLYTSQFHALGCALLSVGFLVVSCFADERPALWRFSRRLFLASLVALPAVVLMLLIMQGAESPARFGPEAQAGTAADLWQFLLHPGIRMTLAEVGIETEWHLAFRAQTWYLPGYLLMAALLWRAWHVRTIGVLLAGAACFWLLALGPWLKIGTPTELNPAPTGIAMPGMLLGWIPGLGTLRSIWHFGFLGTMLAALAGAWCLEELLERWGLSERWTARLLLPLMVYFETSIGMVPMMEPAPNRVAQVLAADTSDYAVFCLPQVMYEIRGAYMYQQTIHGKRLMTGYISRDPAAFERWKRERQWPVELEEIAAGGRERLGLAAELRMREDIVAHKIGWLFLFVEKDRLSFDRHLTAELNRLGFSEQLRFGDMERLVSLRAPVFQMAE